jgi:hypothetical protein
MTVNFFALVQEEQLNRSHNEHRKGKSNKPLFFFML